MCRLFVLLLILDNLTITRSALKFVLWIATCLGHILAKDTFCRLAQNEYIIAHIWVS